MALLLDVHMLMLLTGAQCSEVVSQCAGERLSCPPSAKLLVNVMSHIWNMNAQQLAWIYCSLNVNGCFHRLSSFLRAVFNPINNEICIDTQGHFIHSLLILTCAHLVSLSLSSIQCNTATLSILFTQEKMAAKTCWCSGSIKGEGKGPKGTLPCGASCKGIVAKVDGAPSQCSFVDVADIGWTWCFRATV